MLLIYKSISIKQETVGDILTHWIVDGDDISVKFHQFRQVAISLREGRGLHIKENIDYIL